MVRGLVFPGTKQYNEHDEMAGGIGLDRLGQNFFTIGVLFLACADGHWSFVEVWNFSCTQIFSSFFLFFSEFNGQMK